MDDIRYPKHIEDQYALIMPVLEAAQVERARRFGSEVERFGPGEVMRALLGSGASRPHHRRSGDR